MPPVHPGEMLLEEFLKPLGVSQSAFAIQLGVSFPRLNEIVREKRGVTADTHFAQRTLRTSPSWNGSDQLAERADSRVPPADLK